MANSEYNLYVRIDANNKPIDGTSKMLKNEPRQGRWLKVSSVTGNVCCDFIEMNATPGATTGAVWILTVIACSNNIITLYIDKDSTDYGVGIVGVVKMLNETVGYLGAFNVNEDGTSIDFKINRTAIAGVCATTPTFTLTLD